MSGRGDAYRIYIQRFRGATRVVEKDWKPVSLASDERAEYIARDDYIARQRSRPAADIPKTKPAFQRINVDRDGRIWVSLYTEAKKHELPPLEKPSPVPRLSWSQAPTYDVYDRNGAFLGRITAPEGTSFAAAHGDRLYLQSVGPDDEHLLTAYKLTGLRTKP